jgi:methylmalonyl-CoA mutase cobalamin-binding subunit
MAKQRIVVGSTGDGAEALAVARTLRDAGREVVLAGGGQSAEQLIRTALAEDADEVVVCGGVDFEALESVREQLGAQHVRLTAATGVTDPTRQHPL